MQMRIVSAAGALLVVLLVAVSLAGASSSYKRYTFPAAPPYAAYARGTVTVLLPSGWTVTTKWPPSADNPRSPVVLARWYMDADPELPGTTLADIGANNTKSGCHKLMPWGKAHPRGSEKQLGSGYMTLPVGKVWHSTTRVYHQQGCKAGARDTVMQDYWLDRKMISLRGEQVFLTFSGWCGIKQCPAFNRQLAVIMRSIRLHPR